MFTIIACIKYIRSGLLTINQQPENNYIINPYDLHMLRCLINLKKKLPCRIVSVTMGPLNCIEPIKRSVALGVDDAFLICDPLFSGSDTYATSYILHQALKYISHADIYAFGEKAVDGETGQVPIAVASRLDLPCITGVEEFCVIEGDKIELKRRFDNNIEFIKSCTPCVLCFQGFTIEEPQISLLKLKQVRNYSPIILNADLLNAEKQYCGQNGSKTVVMNIANTIEKRNVKLLDGSPQQKANAFRMLIDNRGDNY